MTVTNKFSKQYITEVHKAEHNLETDNIVACLMKDGFVFDPVSHATYFDISADEIVTGNGYTQRDKIVSGIEISYSGEDLIIKSNNIEWVANGGDIEKSSAAVLINDSHTNKTVILCCEFGEGYSTEEGTMFRLKCTDGLFKVVFM